MKPTTTDAPNKHQLKSEATLRGLLDAAERVFVRDGYERAQMETIAAEAGRTKGAVYAHFRSKEDIFFALLERKGTSRRQEFERAAAGLDPTRRRAAMKKLFLSANEDPTWPILMLEFKLFALRNKASMDRIRDVYKLVYENMSRAISPERAALTAKDKQKDMFALAVLRSIPSAIILEKLFNPTVSKNVATEMLESIFDFLLDMRSTDRVPTWKKTNRAKGKRTDGAKVLATKRRRTNVE